MSGGSQLPYTAYTSLRDRSASGKRAYSRCNGVALRSPISKSTQRRPSVSWITAVPIHKSIRPFRSVLRLLVSRHCSKGNHRRRLPSGAPFPTLLSPAAAPGECGSVPFDPPMHRRRGYHPPGAPRRLGKRRLRAWLRLVPGRRRWDGRKRRRGCNSVRSRRSALDLAAWGGVVFGHPVGAAFGAADVVFISARAGQVTSPGQGIIRL